MYINKLQVSKKTVTWLILAILVIGGLVFGVATYRNFQAENDRLQSEVKALHQEKQDSELVWFQIPEMGIEFQVQKNIKNHISYSYSERYEMGWAEFDDTEEYGNEKCFSNGNKIKEVVLKTDIPFFYGYDSNNVHTLGAISFIDSTQSDNCGFGKENNFYYRYIKMDANDQVMYKLVRYLELNTLTHDYVTKYLYSETYNMPKNIDTSLTQFTGMLLQSVRGVRR